MLQMIIADDEPVILRGLTHFLKWEELGIQIAGTFRDGASAMTAVLEQQPALALLDINMPGLDGIGILRNIHDMNLPTKVIFISGFQDFAYARSALQYGAIAYLLKPVVREELLDAIIKAEEALGSSLPAASPEPVSLPHKDVPSAQEASAGISAAASQVTEGGDIPASNTSAPVQERAAADRSRQESNLTAPYDCQQYYPILTQLILAQPAPASTAAVPEHTSSRPQGTPASAALASGAPSPQQRKLLRFSYLSLLQQAITPDQGTVFTRGDNTMIILPGTSREEIQEKLQALGRKAQRSVAGFPAFLVGDPLADLSHLSGAWTQLLSQKEWFYFAEGASDAIFWTSDSPARGSDSNFPSSLDSLSRIRNRVIEAMVGQNREEFEHCYEQFSRILANASAGKREDACYYYCSSVRSIADYLQGMKLSIEPADIHALLEQARAQENYTALRLFFHTIFSGYYDSITHSVRAAGEKDITAIRQFIDQHYRENLSLEVMAKQFYMNSYYFSSYFKKQTGTNFKDYLAYVRLQHALSLLLTTDMKTYEIAEEVGFADARAFSDAFTRFYHETPTAYRRRAGRQNTPGEV